MRSSRNGQIVLFAILFLFFLQALTDFIQSIYAFGLLVTAFTIQLASVLLLFTPVALVFTRKAPSRPWMAGIACLAILGRLLEPLLDPGGRLVACAVSVGAFMLLFPSLLGMQRESSAESEPGPSGWTAAWGLLIAVLLSITFRTAGSSLDISGVGYLQLIAWMLAGVALRLMWDEAGLDRSPQGATTRPESPDAAVEDRPLDQQRGEHESRREQSLKALEGISKGREPVRKAHGEVRKGGSATPGNERSSRNGVWPICLGLASVIIMLYFAFASPTVIARWTEAPYAAVVGVLLLGTLCLAILLQLPWLAARFSRPVIFAWNALFVTMLVLAILPHQIAFPVDARAYPFDAPPASPAGVVPLCLMLFLSPVIFIDLLLYIRQLEDDAPTIQQLGGGFALAALFVLVMVFLHAFTTIYDYAAPIGPLFRDRFWLVYLLAGLGLVLPLLLIRRVELGADAAGARSRLALGAAVSLAVMAGAALFLTAARPPKVEAVSGGLRVMTFNIQQGFDKVGNADLPGQLAAIRKVAPDVLGLQESDTARVTNGNVDAVRYFADRLNMYSYYGPTTTTGTFGIALLSKYPIDSARTFFLYSTGEQTACIEAKITTGGTTYNVFVTHLGNDGPLVQLQDVLSRVAGKSNVILMGDFNFSPKTPQYALATQMLQDAWLLRWPGGKVIWQQGGEDRIDQMFVSPGTQVLEAEYVPNGDSDHPYLYAVVR